MFRREGTGTRGRHGGGEPAAVARAASPTAHVTMKAVVRALVFDFDGLILDTEVPVFTAWSETYERHGQRLSAEFWTSIVGYGLDHFDPLADLEKRVGRPIDRDAVQAARRSRQMELTLGLEIMPGVREWRSEAAEQGVRLGVASSSGRSWVVGHLARLGLDGWDCVRCGDDVERIKPAPDLYLAVVDCLGVAPEEAIAVEDSGAGVQAAKAAGLYCVAVPSALTAGHDFRSADLVLGSLAEARLTDVALRSGR
jgi:HAD superfamily hydrolase (TIGR01509 family)